MKGQMLLAGMLMIASTGQLALGGGEIDGAAQAHGSSAGSDASEASRIALPGIGCTGGNGWSTCDIVQGVEQQCVVGQAYEIYISVQDSEGRSGRTVMKCGGQIVGSTAWVEEGGQDLVVETVAHGGTLSCDVEGLTSGDRHTKSCMDPPNPSLGALGRMSIHEHG